MITASDGTFDGAIQTGGSSAQYKNTIQLTGGSYTDNPSAYMPADYIVSGDSGNYEVHIDPTKVVEVIPSGQTSGSRYPSLEAAVAAASPYSTLRLLDTVEVNSNLTIGTGSLTIDLNGHDLTGNSTLTIPNAYYLTIQGEGTVACNIDNTAGSIYNLKLNGGSYTGTITGPVAADNIGTKFSETTYNNGNLNIIYEGHELVQNGEWYAFQAITYTIVLHLQGGAPAGDYLENLSLPYASTVDSIALSYTYTGSGIEVPEVDGTSIVEIIRPDYEFGGWYYNEACTGSSAVTATNGSLTVYRLTSNADPDTHVLDLYAKWTEGVAAIGDRGYTSLSTALRHANSGENKTVTLLADTVALGNNTIGADVTLVVPDGKTLTIATANYATLLGSQGTIWVEAGGAIQVDSTTMIGDADANIRLTDGHIDLTVGGTAPDYTLNLSLVGAEAEVPADQRWHCSLVWGALLFP